MGSVGVGLTNPLMINHNNPASYSLIYKQRFIMQTGLYHVTNEMKVSNSDIEKSQITNFSNLSHFNIAFPIAKWWGGSIGLLPYSTFSYSFSDKHDENPSADLFFKGNGGSFFCPSLKNCTDHEPLLIYFFLSPKTFK